MPRDVQHLTESLSWPLERRQGNLHRVRGQERWDVAVRRYVQTAKGALLTDHRFGSVLETVRTQGMGSSMERLLRSDIEANLPGYVPEVAITEVRVLIPNEPADDESFQVEVKHVPKNPLVAATDTSRERVSTSVLR